MMSALAASSPPPLPESKQLATKSEKMNKRYKELLEGTSVGKQEKSDLAIHDFSSSAARDMKSGGGSRRSLIRQRLEGKLDDRHPAGSSATPTSSVAPMMMLHLDDDDTNSTGTVAIYDPSVNGWYLLPSAEAYRIVFGIDIDDRQPPPPSPPPVDENEVKTAAAAKANAKPKTIMIGQIEVPLYDDANEAVKEEAAGKGKKKNKKKKKNKGKKK